MAQQSCLRKAWGIPGLLERVSTCFKTVADPVAGRAFALKDHLMAGLAVFSLEYPSRFQFDSEACGDEAVHTTLTVLFGISDSPSDSGLCKCHDRVDPRSLRPAFKALFPTLQRGKNLENDIWIDDHDLLSLDGTDHVSSKHSHCEHCCEKHHRNGSVTDY